MNDEGQGERSADEFVVVGVGASAGGLEAMFELFDAIPPDPGLAIVVVTHQHPGRTSLLPELLQRHTTMSVAEVSGPMRLRANCVYVSPSGKQLSISEDTLRPIPTQTGARTFPIDACFRSLAAARGSLAVGLVLSGTGSDGTLGLKAIKEAGGMTMAQSAETAAYPAMPRAAERSGVVDHVASPQDAAEMLLRYAPQARRGERERSAPVLESTMRRVIGLLRTSRNHDFTNYKPSTLRRRLLRRFSVHGITEPDEYIRLLETDPDELELLFRELLIGVTSFFRDPEAFTALADEALPALLEGRPEGEPLRAWVAGCSTGEEAYSVAITLQEVMERAERRFPVQVFATDLDPRAVDAARAGKYPHGIAADVGPERLERYFVEEGDHYRVRKEVRETIVFAVQNLVNDPPFTRLDLLVCRNVLIYFDAVLQRRLLPLFHYALSPGGVLFLGSSEGIGTMAEGFDVIDRKWKLFRRRAGVSELLRDPARGPLFPTRDRAAPGVTSTARVIGADQLASTALLGLLAPTVLVDAQGDIVHLHGRTGGYLEPTPGAPRMNVVAMAREGLRLELSSALRESSASEETVVRSHVAYDAPDGPARVTIYARRVRVPEALRGLTAVTFEDEPPEPAGETAAPSAELTRREAELERELAHSRENLQSTIEELETINEELKSTNEELQSTNEELQSTNEELETSREEMQSLNEELQTVNQELQGKIDELSNANDDMRNLLDATQIATIFLDRQLRIQRFTPEATRVVSLIESDVGRPLADLVAKLDYEHLVRDAQTTLTALVPRQREVRGSDGCWYLARMGPYQTADNVVDGIVLTFVDISAVKEAQREVRRARTLAEAIVGAVREPFVVLDADRKIVQSNAAFATMMGDGSLQGRALSDVGHGKGAHLSGLLASRPELLEPGAHELEHDFPGVGRRLVKMSARATDDNDAANMVVLAFDDVEGRRR